MAPETSKDELVGPLKISALRDRDAYERNHTGTAAGVEVFFADETFRGNSGARNALLELMNERTYNGVPVPLRIMVGATNIEDTSVNAEAFNDRFLLRMFVDRIQDPLNFAAYLGAMANRVEYKPNPAHTFTLTEWSQASGDIKSVVIPPGVTAELIKLRDKCHTGKIYVSDRRWGQLLLVLQAKAWLEGLASVEVDHLEILRYGLWLKLSDRVAVDAMISTLDSGDITWISEQADEVLRAVRTWQAKGPQERADTASKIAQTKATAMDAITGKMAGLGPRAKAKAVEKIAEIDATYAPVKKELNRLIAGL
jgi:MoxR-like ATPase